MRIFHVVIHSRTQTAVYSYSTRKLALAAFQRTVKSAMAQTGLSRDYIDNTFEDATQWGRWQLSETDFITMYETDLDTEEL